MAERHDGPGLVAGVLVVPAEQLAELVAELEAPRARAPIGVTVLRRSPRMAALVELARRGAIEHRQRERFRRSSEVVPVAPVPASSVIALPPGARIGWCEGALGVDGVAVALGISERRARVLCGAGVFDGARKHVCRGGNRRRPAQSRWCVPPSAVDTYRGERGLSCGDDPPEVGTTGRCA